MAIGSGIMDSKRPHRPHLNKGEVADLRQDIEREFESLAAIVVEEFTNPPAADTAGILTAQACTTAVQVYAAEDLDGAVGADVMSPPRNITVTTSGETPTDAPATLTVTGLDINGAVMTEDISVPQSVTTAVGAKAFAQVTGLSFTAGQGTDAACAVGFGALMGLGKKAKVRGGLVAVVKEIAAGSLAPTGGTFAVPATGVPNGTYSPNSAADGARDYCLYYELDTSTNRDA